METEALNLLMQQYGIAGAVLVLIAYFLFRTVPKQIAPLLIKVIKDHLDGMTEAWNAHKERLDAAERRSEERHADVLKASREGFQELVKHLQAVHKDIQTHDQHTLSLYHKVDEVLRREVPQSEIKEKNGA